ncbi:alpha/beta hydrolase [Actinotalea sp. JY-7885]|uniref:alpha/beta hydrolase n=1 Tax=Actinotalea sp. JY-7885 TaxID=2758576 RepID=UPI0028164380|nr:alpha/beta hydrolase [Actinotalea sp. JY-7885]
MTHGPGTPPARHDQWHDDVLPGWEALTLDLRPDAQGPGVATLVRRRGVPRLERAVLYVHGYVDYFFQAHLGEAWAAMGYDFYALDLRSYGRSLLAHQRPNDAPDLAVHAEELDRSVRLLREWGHTVVVGHGHSTGGLLLCLWAHERRGRAEPVVDALVLNSPWLELNRGWFDRVVTTRAVDMLGRVAPHTVVSQLQPHYGRGLHRETGGPWDYDLAWKPHEGFGVRAGFIRSVRRGHRAVARGLAVDVPVLVCTSDASGPADRLHEALDRTDSVLAVEHMVERAPRLGPDVTIVQVPGGVHDLALSSAPARDRYLADVARWVAERLPADPPPRRLSEPRPPGCP